MTCGEHCDGESSLIPGTDGRQKLDRLPARCFQRERKRAFSTPLTAQEDSVSFGTLFGHVVTICGRQYLRVYDDAQASAFSSLGNDPFSVWTGMSSLLLNTQDAAEAMSCHF